MSRRRFVPAACNVGVPPSPLVEEQGSVHNTSENLPESLVVGFDEKRVSEDGQEPGSALEPSGAADVPII